MRFEAGAVLPAITGSALAFKAGSNPAVYRINKSAMTPKRKKLSALVEFGGKTWSSRF